MPVQPALIRYSSQSFASNVLEWTERAACIGEDPSIFHILSADDPGCEGMTESQRKSKQNKNFAKAQALCLKCPVRGECLDDGLKAIVASAGQDTYTYSSFSVRGGQLPVASTPRTVGRPLKYVEGQPCPEGHPASRIYINGKYRYCRECKRIEGAGAKGRVSVEARHQAGEFDHAFESVRGKGKASCRICYNAKRRAKESPTGVAETSEERHQRVKGHAPRYTVLGNGKRRCLECAGRSNSTRKSRLNESTRQHAKNKGHEPQWTSATTGIRRCMICLAAKAQV